MKQVKKFEIINEQKYINGAMTFDVIADDKLIFNIKSSDLIYMPELKELKEDIAYYNDTHDKDYERYIKSFNLSITDVADEYVKTSYMSIIGKYSCEDLLLKAVEGHGVSLNLYKSLNSTNEMTLSESKNFHDNCHLYMGKWYFTRKMLHSLVKTMVECLTITSMRKFKQKRGYELNKKAITILTNDMFDNYIKQNKTGLNKDLYEIAKLIKNQKVKTEILF